MERRLEKIRSWKRCSVGSSNRRARKRSLESGVTLWRLNHELLPDPGNPIARMTTPLEGRSGGAPLCPADGVVLPHLHLRAVVAAPPEAQPTCLGLPPAAAGPESPAPPRRPALGGKARYRRMPAAAGRVRPRFLLSEALFCGASGARSSICACLACNTPGAS